MIKMSLDEIYVLAKKSAMACGASDINATSLAVSIREAEAEGLRNIGLAFLPYYCGHLLTGAIVGDADPEIIEQSPAVVWVDGKNGFAHPAYDKAEHLFYEKARICGLAAMSLKNVYYNGVEGYFVKRMAEQGLVGFACTIAASMVSPYGGSKPLFGTNPLAFGVPRSNQPPLVIDLSTSTTAFVNVAAAAGRGDSIPDNWALDANGNPTTDPNDGLAGSLQPLGGAKGTGLGLMVEVLAAGLVGSRWSFELPTFTEDMSDPPALGQFYMAISPGQYGNPNFASRIEILLQEMLSQQGVRLPGDSRIASRVKTEANGVELDDELYRSLLAYADR
jgi:(2R)-3-sulfolactate dehydrogenase (NADP+)